VSKFLFVAHYSLQLFSTTVVIHVVLLMSHLWELHYCLKRLLTKELIKCVLIFSTTLSETFLILRGIQPDIIINTQRSSCKVPVSVVRF
jgi:hypothetical protein